MKSRTSSTWLWLAAITIIIGQSILIYKLLWQQDASALNAVGWITGAVFPALTLIYGELQKRSLTFFLLTQQIQGFLVDKPATWNLSAHFSGKQITAQTLNAIADKLVGMSRDFDGVKVDASSQGIRRVELGSGPTLHIRLDTSASAMLPEVEAQTTTIHVSISNYRVNYRNAHRVIKYEIMPVLEAIASVINNVDAKYTMVIQFDKKRNPFFGLYVAKFDPETVSNFFIRIAHGPSESVLVSESKIQITAESQTKFQNLALQFLTFDLSLRERFNSG